jgi:hypothetical protein
MFRFCVTGYQIIFICIFAITEIHSLLLHDQNMDSDVVLDVWKSIDFLKIIVTEILTCFENIHSSSSCAA